MTRPRQHARAFSLVELLLVIVVIFMLMGLLLGGFRFARGYAKRAADRTTVKSLQQAVSYFQQQMGFLPPLVKDQGDPPGYSGGPIRTAGGENRPDVFLNSVANDLEFLRTNPLPDDPDYRFSLYSFPYYLLGACEVSRTTAPSNPPVPIDGVPGPGMFAAKRDGAFERAGQRFEPFFDTARNAKAVVTVDAANGRVELRDSNNVAFRYYRWENGKATAGANGTPGPIGSVNNEADLNIPIILGDRDDLKGAKYAIVAAGPDGVFGNEDQIYVRAPNHPQAMTREAMAIKLGISTPTTQPEIDRMRARAMQDNIVEVGK